MSNYRDHLVRSLCRVEGFLPEIFLAIVNLGMSGELKEMDDRFEVGESFAFKQSDFESLSDQNVQRLLALKTEIEDTLDFLQNINAVSDAEMESKQAELDEENCEEISEDDEDNGNFRPF